jgi:hypothetical protein
MKGKKIIKQQSQVGDSSVGRRERRDLKCEGEDLGSRNFWQIKFDST